MQLEQLPPPAWQTSWCQPIVEPFVLHLHIMHCDEANYVQPPGLPFPHCVFVRAVPYEETMAAVSLSPAWCLGLQGVKFSKALLHLTYTCTCTYYLPVFGTNSATYAIPESSTNVLPVIPGKIPQSMSWPPMLSFDALSWSHLQRDDPWNRRWSLLAPCRHVPAWFRRGPMWISKCEIEGEGERDRERWIQSLEMLNLEKDMLLLVGPCHMENCFVDQWSVKHVQDFFVWGPPCLPYTCLNNRRKDASYNPVTTPNSKPFLLGVEHIRGLLPFSEQLEVGLCFGWFDLHREPHSMTWQWVSDAFECSGHHAIMWGHSFLASDWNDNEQYNTVLRFLLNLFMTLTIGPNIGPMSWLIPDSLLCTLWLYDFMSLTFMIWIESLEAIWLHTD